MAPTDQPTTPLFYRILPEGIGGRLILTVVLFVAVTSAFTISVSAWLVLSGAPQNIAVLGSVLSGFGAVALGIVVAIVLNRAMRAPVDHLVDHVKACGERVARGEECGLELSDANLGGLPLELRELGAIVDDLLQHLSERQAELGQAMRNAEFAEETLGSVVSESQEAKIVLQDGRVIIANPAASVAFARPVEAMHGRTFGQALEGILIRDVEDAPIDPLALLDVALEGPVTVSLARTGLPDRWYVFQAFPHTDDLHNRVVISARDITEERRLEALHVEVASLVSHDLKTPLSVVIGYLDVLRKPLSEEDRLRAIDGAKRNAERMADLIEDLLSATRSDELLAPVKLEPIPVLGIASEVVASLGALNGVRQPGLLADCDPVVMGEQKRLRQVLVNLVSNAFKYSSQSEPIDVRIRCDKKNVYLEVVDHGPGIPKADRDRIFKRFERLDKSGKRPGMGLGLYIVSIIAENHGGIARVEETPGGGATFVIELPLAGHVVNGRIVRERAKRSGRAG
jgi:signal transduction histidine kinase